MGEILKLLSVGIILNLNIPCNRSSSHLPNERRLEQTFAEDDHNAADVLPLSIAAILQHIYVLSCLKCTIFLV